MTRVFVCADKKTFAHKKTPWQTVSLGGQPAQIGPAGWISDARGPQNLQRPSLRRGWELTRKCLEIL